MRIYLFPAVLFFATGLLCVKVVALFSDVVAPVIGISTAVAQDGTAAAGRLREQQLKLGAEKDRKKELSKKEIREIEKKSQAETDKLFEGEDITTKQNKGLPSKSDIALLKGLSARRVSLDEREKGLLLRENLIRAAEKKVEDRIRELKALEARVTKISRANSEENSSQYKKLVGMYEKMKPKSAAQIFNSLHMSVLAGVAERMKEGKIAAVMAKMEVKAAKRLTMEMARREVQKEVVANTALPRVTED